MLECAVDDLSPQVLAHTAQLALERGALDVMSGPVTMKKGRLGTLLTVLCKPGDADPSAAVDIPGDDHLGDPRAGRESRHPGSGEHAGADGFWRDPCQDRLLAGRRMECGAGV